MVLPALSVPSTQASRGILITKQSQNAILKKEQLVRYTRRALE